MDLTGPVWRKSTYSSSSGGNCVEVASLPGAVAVRDSKDPEGGALAFPAEAWRSFIAGIKRGQHS